MDLVLGIDTGGTYTDAVLVDHSQGRVICSAKSLTTYDDLSRGIGRAVDGVLDRPDAPPAEEISLIGLSTTLATNAIVEGRGGRVCLVLIGYDREMIASYNLKRELVVKDVVHLAGGHDSQGQEVAALDEEGLKEAARSRKDRVDAFGVSSYFGVRNPEHELRAKEILESLTGLPVTCGHELTSRLDSIRRATTVALNAGLIPLIRDLIGSVRKVLADRRISGRLMVVKGDGSLVDDSWAIGRPIETILSGPAASVIGARHLLEREKNGDLWVMDIGGTTTDIARLREGQPGINPQGARVGGWQTMVEAVDIRTVGLGGDSRVRVDLEGGLSLGPERVIPLCLTAAEHPGIVEELKRQERSKRKSAQAGLFLVALGGPRSRPDNPWEAGLLSRLAQGPVAWERLVQEGGPASYLPGQVLRAAARHLIAICGFTPTDALHVLGRLDLWPAEASLSGAAILALRAGKNAGELAQQVIEKVHANGAEALARAALAGQGLDPGPGAGLDLGLLGLALSENGNRSGDIGVALTLSHPVAAIGAPAVTYGRAIAAKLNTELLLPPKAEVANAVGAVAGGVVIRQRVLIKPMEGEGWFRLHLPHEVRDCDDREEAVAKAREFMEGWLREAALRAGADQPQVTFERRDMEAPVRRRHDETLYLGTELICVAVGRPSPARNKL